MKAYDQAIGARLKRLLRDHNQAKLARATGRSRNALTRYVQGAKLPMSFGAALVDELGVNPAWLLRGEEPMYLADVPAATGEIAGELLRLMRALDQVSALKLGALSGRKHADALRELSHTLDRYGSLRDRINRISAPVLSELLRQAEQANDQRRLDHAQALIKAAFRVQQFCDDRELAQRLLSAQALLRHIEQNAEEALRLQMGVFQSRMSLDADFDQVGNAAAGLAQVLRSNQLAGKALRVVRMALALASAKDKGGANWAMLQGQQAMARVELCEYRGVEGALHRAILRSPPQERPLLDAAKTYHDLNSGRWNPAELAGGKPTTFAAAAMILNAAYCFDDEAAIEAALARARELVQPQMPLNLHIVARATNVLKTMRTKTLSGALEEKTARTAAAQFSEAVPRGQLLRLARDKRARTEVERAQHCLERLEPGISPNPFQVALHLRNVLEVAPDARDALRVRALALASERIAAGHGLLRAVIAASK